MPLPVLPDRLFVPDAAAPDGTPWDRDARAAGCDAILLRGGASVFAWNTAAEFRADGRADGNAGRLPRFVEIDLARIPAGHPAIAADPDAFVGPQGAADAPVDPRAPTVADGEVRARVEDPGAARALAGALAVPFAELAAAGVAGVVVTRAAQVAPALLALLAERLRTDGGPMLLAAADMPLPVAAEAAIAAYVCDPGGSDHAPREVADALLRLGAGKPVLAIVPPGDGPASALAAALARGVCLTLDAARTLPRATQAARYRGPLRRLSAASAPVAVVMRAEGTDWRSTPTALLVLANLTGAPQSPPTALSRQVGLPFGPLAAGDALQPYEVRILPLDRTAPILRSNRRKAGADLRDLPRLVVDDVSPTVAGGDYPIKRVVGDMVTVEAAVFTDGHEQLAVELRWRAEDEKGWQSVRMDALPTDRWRAAFPLERIGRHEFVVEGWLDVYGGFRRDFRKKLDAGVAQPVDHAEGRALVAQAADRVKGRQATALKKWCAQIDQAEGAASADLLLDDELAALMDAVDARPHALASAPQLVDAERLEARFSSWYELFPRSMTDDKARHGTFADVADHLPRVRDMGFDTLYFPPIHPIGRTNRKGPNNTLTPEEGDPGSPYAIGSDAGGHDAIHPELGSFDDFDRLVAAAAEHGLEIALDFAIQASPDHPWLTQHPGWFAWRPDGSMKYAENPPKKYQDIVNVDFYGPDAVPGLWAGLRDVILLWVEHGVKTFRVDNPHTKPLPFWEWMIAEVRGRHPDVIFLSEAFTRPTMMYQLAKVGFSQSYTYFTWREGKQELVDYITELTTTAPKDFYRPHFFVNTPDINPFHLQTGGRPAHRIRAALAATLSGLWGVYSGFELCDAAPLGPGKEEYLDSEKFEIRPRDWRVPGDIVDDITTLNRLRRDHAALQTHLNTQFYPAYDDHILYYGKPSPDGAEMLLVMVNLDPHNPHECDFEVPLWEFGLGDDAAIAVEDMVGGYRFDWHGKVQHIRLEPDEPYRIWRLAPGGQA